MTACCAVKCKFQHGIKRDTARKLNTVVLQNTAVVLSLPHLQRVVVFQNRLQFQHAFARSCSGASGNHARRDASGDTRLCRKDRPTILAVMLSRLSVSVSANTGAFFSFSIGQPAVTLQNGFVVLKKKALRLSSADRRHQ